MRRALVIVPLVGALAAVVGVLQLRPVVAVVVGGVLGLAAAAALSWAIDRRLDDITTRVRHFAEGGEPEPDIGGSPAWRRLTAALAEVGATLRQRYADLAEERARGERLLDSLPTAILLFDRTRMSYANPVAQRLFGVRRAEARSPLQVLGVEALAIAVAEARETGRSLDLQVTREDRELTAHVSVPGEDVVALILTDVTEARRLEAVRRDFVTNASHELKTPVAGIQALADSLRLAVDRDPSRARTMITRVQSEAARLATLVRDLLDLSRLEEESAARERQRVDLADTVRTQVKRIESLAEARGVKVGVAAPDRAWIVALPADLRLIVANLLENAVRYNRPGGWVDVRVWREGAEVVLEVEDNGIGIPAADRDRVFERFYRVDKARSRAAGGTGLGLAIVRHATERHGGEVSVRSILGEGTVFRVVLPVEGTRPTHR